MNFGKYLNTIFFPLRMILSPENIRKIGLKTLADDRMEMVLPYVRGKLLDIGCGENLLVKKYLNGVGVDVYPWQGVDIICDTKKLPFKKNSFDTVTFLASLNHIPEREKVLGEANRVLKPGGRILATMISKKVGTLSHKITARSDPDQNKRKIKAEEELGINPDNMVSLLKDVGFSKIVIKKFGFMKLNTLFIAERNEKI